MIYKRDMKKISIAVLIVFILSNAVYGAGDSLHKTSLRPPLVYGKGKVAEQNIKTEDAMLLAPFNPELLVKRQDYKGQDIPQATVYWELSVFGTLNKLNIEKNKIKTIVILGLGKKMQEIIDCLKEYPLCERIICVDLVRSNIETVRDAIISSSGALDLVYGSGITEQMQRKVQFYHADMQEMPAIQNGSVDLIVGDGLVAFDGVGPAIEEWIRKLKPGGFAYVGFESGNLLTESHKIPQSSMKSIEILKSQGDVLMFRKITTDKEGLNTAGQEIKAEEVFREVWKNGLFLDDELLQTARMVDELMIGPNDNILCPGAGNFWSYIVACAVKGANVDIVQPAGDGYWLNQGLQHEIELNARLIKLRYSIDISSKIDNSSYQTLLQHANVPERHYSYAFVLHVLDIIEDEKAKEEFIAKLLSALKDESYILISAWGRGAEKEVRILREYGAKLGYDISEPTNSFFAVNTTVYKLKVVRNPKVEVLPESPAEQAL